MNEDERRTRDAAGLCAACRSGRAQRGARGSVFWRCLRADVDARFRRYPPLPVRECEGFEPDAGGAETPHAGPIETPRVPR